MERPNWFDQKYSGKLEKASAQDALQVIAGDDRVRQAVAAAIQQFDANIKKPGWAGPSRTQFIRQALAGCLSAQD